MSTLIIVIAVVAIALLLVLRSRQNKAPDSKKTTTSTSKKATGKKAKPVEEKQAETRPRVDISNVLSQIDVLIADKEYAKAEGIINQALNKDASLHELYPKLLHLYQLQDDDFAIKQLLDTVQNLNLNAVYQQLYNDYEAYKIQKSNPAINAAPLSQSQSDIIEFTPSPSKTIDTLEFPQTTTQSTQTREHQQQNNTLAFDQISFDSPASAPPETTDKSTEHVLDFNLSDTITKTTDNSLPAINHEQHSPTLEFSLEEPAVAESRINPEPLEFKLDNSNSSATDETPALAFHLSEPTVDTPPEFTFDLDTTTFEATEAAVEELPTETAITFADLNDPLVQTFPVLQNTDPAELDIELAEQYIRFGEYSAAKNILNLVQTQLSEQQAVKVNQLLQKIAS